MTAVNYHNPLEGTRPEMEIKLQDGSQEQVSIVVVTKDRPEWVNIALQTITNCSVNNNYEIILVDNASTTQEAISYFKEMEEDGIKVIRNEKNEYWSGAVNKGFAAANKNSKYLICMHDDVVILNPGWIDILINVASVKKSGLVGLSLNRYQMQGQNVDFIEEWLMLMTRECWNDIGPWPEKLPLIGHSFIMTTKAHLRGYKPHATTNQIAYHYKITSIDLNEWERLSEQASSVIPQVIKEIYSQPVKPIAN